MDTDLGVSRRGFIKTVGVTSALVGVAGTVLSASRASADSTVTASSFGYSPTDSTQYLQAALDSSASTVIIDYVAGGWYTGPLFLTRSDVTVVIEPDVMIRAVPGGFSGATDSLLKISSQSNILISGYGATIAMNKAEYTTGETRMALLIYASQNITVEGLTLRDSGGDGVYIGPLGTQACGAIVLRDLVCDNHRRNALSVTSVDGLTVEGCAFLNSNGTSPESGVDFEPNTATSSLANILVQDCVFAGNGSSGLRVYAGHLDGTSPQVSMQFTRLTVGGQVASTGGAPSVLFSSLRSGLQGTLDFRDSLIDVAPNSGALEVAKDTDSATVTAERITIWDVGNALRIYRPLEFAGYVSQYGELTMSDSVVVTDQAPFLTCYDGGGSQSIDGLHGTLTVSDVNGVQADYGPNPTNVDLVVRTETPGSATQVDVNTGEGIVAGGDTVDLVFTRLGGDLTAPLAIAYETSGTARERYDYRGLGKVAVIPPGERKVTIEVQTYAQRRTSDPLDRSLVVSIVSGHRYVSGVGSPDSVTIHG